MDRPSSTKLLKVFTRLDGCRSRGFLTTAAMPTSGVVSMPIRLIHMLRPCMMVPGNILRLEDGTMIMLMLAEQGQDIYQTFQAVLVTTEFSWSRKSQILDPVSKVMRDGPKIELGGVYAYFDRPVDVQLEKLVESRYQFFTGQNVRVGDTVGTKLVQKVVPIAGVNLVFAE